jgi:hypothetical protein
VLFDTRATRPSWPCSASFTVQPCLALQPGCACAWRTALLTVRLRAVSTTLAPSRGNSPSYITCTATHNSRARFS